MPPLPHSPPSSDRQYQFGAEHRPWNAPPQKDFTFRPINSAPQYPKEADVYRPSRTGQYDMNGPRRAYHGGIAGNGSDNRQNHTTHQRDYRPNRGRGYKHHATADRPLLKFNRGNTPEQMLGMNEDQQAEHRFLDIDDMSDSAEEAMDESDLDDYDPPLEVAVSAGDSGRVTRAQGTEDMLGVSVKMETCGPQHEVARGSGTIPKWSNPEYYTALPPPDESQRNKRDVVKLIRKARVVVGKKTASTNQVAANDDFISFGLEEKKLQSENNAAAESITSPGRGVFGAPSGPRSAKQTSSSDPYYLLGTTGPSPNTTDDTSTRLAGNAPTITNGGLKKNLYPEVERTEVLRPPKRKKGAAPFSNGRILEEWLPTAFGNPLPWTVQNHRFTENPGFRLHKEICDFYEFVKPQKFEQVVREELLERLRTVVRKWRADCELHSFGSFAAGLYLPNADMDVVVVSQDFKDRGWPSVCQSGTRMRKLATFLQEEGVSEPWSVEIIASAKVPLIKFVDRVTNLRVDMSFENDTGLLANDTFRSWKAEYPAMPILVTLIKQFLMIRGLNEVVNGGLGGFSVTCLVTSLLQNMPRIRTGELVPEHHLGEVLLEFLDLYGNQLDIARTGIRMRPGGYFDKRQWNIRKPSKPDRLCIIDPNKPDNDISGGSRNIMLIFSRFSRAHEEIINAMSSSNRASFLDWMVGGNYNDFLWQRRRLRNIYTERWGTPDREDAEAVPQSGANLGPQSRHRIPSAPRSVIKSESAKVTPETKSYSGLRSTDGPNHTEQLHFPSTAVANPSINISQRGRASPQSPKQTHWQSMTRIPENVDVNAVAMAKAHALLKAAQGDQQKLFRIHRTEKEKTGSRRQGAVAERKQTQQIVNERLMTTELLRVKRLLQPPSSASGLVPKDLAEESANALLNSTQEEARLRVAARENFVSQNSTRNSETWLAERNAAMLLLQFPHLRGTPWEQVADAANNLLRERGIPEQGLVAVVAGEELIKLRLAKESKGEAKKPRALRRPTQVSTQPKMYTNPLKREELSSRKLRNSVRLEVRLAKKPPKESKNRASRVPPESNAPARSSLGGSSQANPITIE